MPVNGSILSLMAQSLMALHRGVAGADAVAGGEVYPGWSGGTQYIVQPGLVWDQGQYSMGQGQY